MAWAGGAVFLFVLGAVVWPAVDTLEGGSFSIAPSLLAGCILVIVGLGAAASYRFLTGVTTSGGGDSPV